MAEIDIFTAPRLDVINLLRPETDQREVIRALHEAFRSVQQALDFLELLAGKIKPILEANSVEGKAGTGLTEGMVCYLAGDTWLPCNTGTAGAWPRGVATAVTKKTAVVQVTGIAEVRIISSPVAGSLVYPSATSGYVSDTPPDPATAEFWAWVGFTLGTAKSGKVKMIIRPIGPDQ